MTQPLRNTAVDRDGKALPEIGDAFLVPLGTGTFSFCWVVDVAERGKQYWNKRTRQFAPADVITIAGAKWFGKEPPTAADLTRPKLLTITNPLSTYKRRRLLVLAENQPPSKLRPLGKVGRAAVGKCAPDGYAGWYAIETEARTQWAWQQAPGATVAKAEAKETVRLTRNAAAAARNEVRVRARTLAAWTRTPDLLADLAGMMPRRRAGELTTLVRNAARGLLDLGTEAPRRGKLAVLEALVLEINAWQARVGPGVIETAEREVLCETIDRIGKAAGLRGAGFCEALRDW